MIQINLPNKLTFTIIVIFAILIGGITVYAYNSGGPPNLLGHSSDEVKVKIDGVPKTLQEAIVDGDLGGDTFVDCKNWRSDVFNKDAVVWCGKVRPNMLHCSIIDDEAPFESPTDLSDCSSNGLCPANGLRQYLSRGESYIEIVKQEDGRQGCWQYDPDHSRHNYRLEIVCCK